MIRRIADEVLINGQAYENLRTLTKHIGPRLSGSRGMVKAESWGLNVMQQSGADKAWLQQCMVPHWVRGGKDEASFNVYMKKNLAKLDVIALGNSVGTGSKRISAQVIEVKSFADLEA